MIRKHKFAAIFSTLCILLCIPVGLLLNGWNLLSVGLPCFLLILHWVGLLCTQADHRNHVQSEKALMLVFWLVPLIACFSCGMQYSLRLGRAAALPRLIAVMLGLLFLVIGNYAPKFRRNHSLGIRTPWAVASEDNWRRTHRFGGIIYAAVGVIILCSMMLPTGAMVTLDLFCLLCAILIPALYSYGFYRKQRKSGSTEAVSLLPHTKWGAILLAAFLLALIPLNLLGSVKTELGDTALTVQATFWEDFTLPYTEIDEISYREDCETGLRTNGFGSVRLCLGQFQNEEFGSYTRYSYTGCDAAVVLEIGGETLVLNGADEAATQELYQSLLGKIEQAEKNG